MTCDLTQEIEAAAKKYAAQYEDPIQGRWAKSDFISGANLLKARVERLEEKVHKLKALMLLTDPVVSGVVVSETALTQWGEFIKCFPDEGKECEK